MSGRSAQQKDSLGSVWFPPLATPPHCPGMLRTPGGTLAPRPRLASRRGGKGQWIAIQETGALLPVPLPWARILHAHSISGSVSLFVEQGAWRIANRLFQGLRHL